MKKIINGKSYNTETAKEILAVAQSSFSSGEIAEKIVLYRKKSGEYFFYSWHSKRILGYIPDDRIELTDEEYARKFIEKHANHLYEKIFGTC